MKKNKIALLACLSLAVPLLAGCGNNDKWGYNEEEASKATYLDASISKDNAGKYEFNVSETYPYFTATFTLDDVICFNLSKMSEEIENDPNFDEKALTNIDFFRKYSVETSDLKLVENHGKVNFTFSGNDDDYFSCLFSKEASEAKNFICATALDTYSGMVEKKTQRDFEINYLDMEAPKWNQDKTKLDVYSYFHNIFELPTKEGGNQNKPLNMIPPGVIIKAIEIGAEVIGTIVDAYQEATTPTIEDVYNKLNEIDDHITELSNQVKQMGERMEHLFNEQVLLHEKTQFNQYTSDINNFDLLITSQVDHCISTLNQFLSARFKEFISQRREVSIFYKLVDDQYEVSDVNDGTYTEYKLSVDDFANAKEHVSKHGNSIETGFGVALEQDLIKAAIGATRPEYVSEKEFASNVYSIIENGFLRAFFTKDNDNAFNLREAFILFAKGVATTLVNAQVERARLMSNFASETTEYLRKNLSNLLFKVDKICSLATIASEYAELSAVKEIGEAYELARDAIIKAFNNEKKLAKNYSYVVGAPLTGSTIVYDANPFVKDSNGKYIGYNKSYTVYNRYGNVNKEIGEGFFKEHALSEEEAIRITRRYALLSEDYKNDNSFIDYLIYFGVYPEEQVVDSTGKRYASNFIYNKITVAPLTKDDKNLALYRNSKYLGPASADNLGDHRHYLDYLESHWKQGEKILINAFDANTGSFIGPQLCTASAQYFTAGFPLIKIGQVDYAYKLENPPTFYTLFK